MKVLCILALLTTADGNFKSDLSEIMTEIFGAGNSTSVATSNDRNSTAMATNNDRNSIAIATSNNRNSMTSATRDFGYNFADYTALRKKISHLSRSKGKSRLRISASNSSRANLCNYTKEYLQTLLGDWTLTMLYAQVLPERDQLHPVDYCVTIRVAPSKGICKCRGQQLPVFNAAITGNDERKKGLKDVAVAFVSNIKDAVKFGNQHCQCKRQIITVRVLSANYIMLYESNDELQKNLDYLLVLARNVSAMWELENLEKTTPELAHRKRAILCENIVVYTTLKSGRPSDDIGVRRAKSVRLGFGLSTLSFFDYLNTIPREEFLEIAMSSGVPV